MRTTLSGLFFILFISCTAFSQPYNDPYGISYWYIPSKIRGDTKFFRINGVLPINLNCRKEKFLIVPSYENWAIKSNLQQIDIIHLHGLTVPIAFNLFSKDLRNEYLISAIVKSNAKEFRFNGNVFQLGGAILYKHRCNDKLRLNVGFYLNKEFFKIYWTPLVGMEWKISEKCRVFGDLPNSFKFEYKNKENLAFGCAFKGITTSFRLKVDSEDYIRINDAHLTAFTDFYFLKNFVLSLEGGHTLFREISSNNLNELIALEGDGFVFKSGIFYRLPNDLW